MFMTRLGLSLGALQNHNQKLTRSSYTLYMPYVITFLSDLNVPPIGKRFEEEAAGICQSSFVFKSQQNLGCYTILISCFPRLLKH